jgi:hypothetical protein
MVEIPRRLEAKHVSFRGQAEKSYIKGQTGPFAYAQGDSRILVGREIIVGFYPTGTNFQA